MAITTPSTLATERLAVAGLATLVLVLCHRLRRARSQPPPVAAAVSQPDAVLRLRHVATGLIVELLDEHVGKGRHMLARPSHPYQRLHRSQQRGTLGGWRQTAGNAAALWSLVEEVAAASDEGTLRICSLQDASLCLQLGASGEFCLGAAESAHSVWRRLGAPAPLPESAAAGASTAEFGRDGYVMLPGLVPQDKLERALRYLNHHLGSADLAADLEPEGLGVAFAKASAGGDGDGGGGGGNGVVKLGSGRPCMCSVAQAVPLLDLVGPAERRAIRTALGSHAAGEVSPTYGCQVALRFPLAPFGAGVVDGEAALAPLMAKAADWHTDAAKYNEKKSFDFVLGIFLSRVATSADGALFVLPGSHVEARAQREAGRLARGNAPGRSTSLEDSAPPPLEAARPILAEPGTAIVFDKDLLHTGGPCLAPGIRYALYYRMRLEGG